LFVDASFAEGPINPFVYGSNTGPWQTVGLEQIPLSKAGGIRLIRWPGGNWGDENDITALQLDEFMKLAHAIGAEPLIHVRLYGGTPEQAAALVRLANIEKKYGVRYWAVGNEPDLFVKKRGAKSYTAADYARDFKLYKAAMKAVDPSIILLGPEISQYTGPTSYPVDATGVNWMEGFLKDAGADVDIVTVHRYPFGDPPATPQTLLADPPSWTTMMNNLRAQVQRASGRDIPLAVTEANSDWTGRVDNQSGTNSHLNAIWWADVLGRLIRARSTIVAQFCLGAISGQGIGIFGPISYGPQPLPIYQVYPLYQQFGNQLVHSSSDDESLPIVASRRTDGKLAILVINHAATERSAPIILEGAQVTGPAEVWSFAEDHPVQQRGTADINGAIAFEPQSATVLVVAVK
jgi:alpha-L-arabinofuranosidase